MNKPFSSGLRAAFLTHSTVALFFGVIYLFFPTQYGEMVDWPVLDPIVYRLLGAALFSLGISSWLAYRAVYWEQVKILVILEICWTSLGTLFLLWGLVSEDLPVVAWINTGLFATFAIVFLLFYIQETESEVVKTAQAQ